MIILAIETSCDETAVAVIKANALGTICKVLAHTVLTQINIHKEYGGVFPMLAKREHARVIITLLEKCLREAGLAADLKKNVPLPKSTTKKILKLLEREENTGPELVELFQRIKIKKIDAIAVTSGPGLEPALWVGINTALALSVATSVSVYPINHMEGHIIAARLQAAESNIYKLPKLTFPAIALLISGGHTELVHIKKPNKYQIIGQTRDDAVGEAFDKVARMLGLPYPGGPEISRLANTARARNTEIPKDSLLPRPMLHSKDLDFSFSGLKTAVLYKLKKYPKPNQAIKESIALDFENATSEVLVKKTLAAARKVSAREVIVGGGVSANTHIQKELRRTLSGVATVHIPSKNLSTDNALMIAVTAMVHLANKAKPKKKIVADGNWHL